MTRLFTVLAALSLLLVAAPASANEAGKTVFTTYCSACHGADGNGDGAAAAGLDPKPANLNDAAFWETRDEAHVTKVVTEGGAAVGKSPLMAAWGAVLSAEQLKDVVAFVVSKKPAAPAAAPADAPK